MFFFLQWEIIQYFCPFIKLLLFSFFIKWVIFPYQNRALVGSQWNWHDWPEVSRRIRTMPNRPITWVVQPDGYRRSLHIETKAQAIHAVCKVKLNGVMDQFKKIWIRLVFKWNDTKTLLFHDAWCCVKYRNKPFFVLSFSIRIDEDMQPWNLPKAFAGVCSEKDVWLLM